MKWQQVREAFPGRWVLVEAINASTSPDGHREIDELMVVQAYDDDWEPAWEGYKQAKTNNAQGEYYMLHTDRAELDIEVIDRFGRKMTG